MVVVYQQKRLFLFCGLVHFVHLFMTACESFTHCHMFGHFDPCISAWWHTSYAKSLASHIRQSIAIPRYSRYRNLPSGHVKIAIENGHRNSGLSPLNMVDLSIDMLNYQRVREWLLRIPWLVANVLSPAAPTEY